MKANILAQTVNINGQQIKGPLEGIDNIGSLVSRLLIFIIPIAATILVFVFIWGGYDYMMSQGNPEKVKSAQAKITTGLIGFILMVISFLVVRIIAQLVGLPTGIL